MLAICIWALKSRSDCDMLESRQPNAPNVWQQFGGIIVYFISLVVVPSEIRARLFSAFWRFCCEDVLSTLDNPHSKSVGVRAHHEVWSKCYYPRSSGAVSSYLAREGLERERETRKNYAQVLLVYDCTQPGTCLVRIASTEMVY